MPENKNENNKTWEFTMIPTYINEDILSELAGTPDNFTMTFQVKPEEENDCPNYDCKYYDCAPSCYDGINNKSRCKDCCLNKEEKEQMANQDITIPVKLNSEQANQTETHIERMGQRVVQLQKEIQKAYDMLEDLEYRVEDLGLAPKFYGSIYHNCAFNYGKNSEANAWNGSVQEIGYEKEERK